MLYCNAVVFQLIAGADKVSFRQYLVREDHTYPHAPPAPPAPGKPNYLTPPSPINAAFFINIINRPGVAGTFLHTALGFIHSFIHSLSHPFPPNLQDIINPKPLELGS